MTAELILQEVQKYRDALMEEYKKFLDIGNVNLEVMHEMSIRIIEQDQVIEIIKSCIAAGEDDGK